MLSHEDAAELERALAIGQFERSPIGAQLDHLLLYSFQEPHNGMVDARPTREVRQSAKPDPDLGMLEVYGKASRRLQRVAERDATLAAVLVAYYGDTGARWARGKQGRLGAVVHLTEAGQKLSKRSERKSKGAKLAVSAAERVETEAALQEAQPTVTRQQALDLAMRQALELFTHACDAYTATKRPEPEKSKRREPIGPNDELIRRALESREKHLGKK